MIPRDVRRVALLAAAAVVAAFLYPAVVGGTGTNPNFDRVALALALGGPAAGAALAAAAGRPLLAAAALSGVAGYVSGLLSLHGVAVPLAVVGGTAAATAAGALIAVIGGRLDGAAFLVVTLLLAIAGGAAIQALPGVTGAESGLGPLSALSVPLGSNRSAVLTPVGNFHALLAAAAITIAIAALLTSRGPGPAWRALGSDRRRAADVGISALRSEIAVLAVGAALAGLCGALSAHVSRVANPSAFAPDVAALPLLAAVAAGREPLLTGIIAVATGLVGLVVLPAAGWQGPPDAMSLAIGILGVAALFTLVPGGASRREQAAPAVDSSAEWPLELLHLSGARLSVDPMTVRGRDLAVLVDAPAFTVEAGQVQAVVGANGSGKSTLLRAIAERARRPGSGVTVATQGGRQPRVLELSQEGGGFAACTVTETLDLSARRGLAGEQRQEVAAAWQRRIGLEGSGAKLCVELSSGQRRLLDLARVMLCSPEVLLCDEPLAGLDDSHRAAARACIRAAAAAGVTVVLAEHDRQAVAELADATIELERQAHGASAAAAGATT